MKLATRCPHCHGDLASGQKGKHCKSKACGWLKHRCGATVDPRTGHGTHQEHPRYACQSDNSPCARGRG